MQATKNHNAGLRCGIYARVSTADQNCTLQLNELREFATRNGFTVTDEFVDHGVSGTKASRPELNRMLAQVREGRIRVILCWKMDRLCRSLAHLVQTIQEFDALGIRVIFTTQNIDTDKSNPLAKLLCHLMGAFSEFERSLLVERTLAGVKAARAKGRVAGRPKRIFDRAEVARLRDRGMSWRAIARELNIPLSTTVDAFYEYHRTEIVQPGAAFGDGNESTSRVGFGSAMPSADDVRYGSIANASAGVAQ